MKLLVLLLLATACAHKMDHRVLSEKVNQMEQQDIEVIKADMNSILAVHPEMTQEMKGDISGLLEKHLTEHQRLKAEESKALQVILEDSIIDPDAVTKSFGKQKLDEIYRLKSKNVLDLITAIKTRTTTLKDRPAFYREMSILMRELR